MPRNNNPVITEVYYGEIREGIIDAETCGDFYFLHNLLHEAEAIDDAYVKYFENMMWLKNNMIGDLKANKRFPRDPKIDASSIMISSLKNKAILLVEY